MKRYRVIFRTGKSIEVTADGFDSPTDVTPRYVLWMGEKGEIVAVFESITVAGIVEASERTEFEPKAD